MKQQGNTLISRNCIEFRLFYAGTANVSFRMVYWNRVENGTRLIKSTDAVCFARDSRFSYLKFHITEQEVKQ